MPRLQPMDPGQATGKAKALLDGVQAAMGRQPNILKTMANSPAVLEAYLNFSGALKKGMLPGKLRERIALAVAEANKCHYCVAAHTAISRAEGLTDEEAMAARHGAADDPGDHAAVRFAVALSDQNGNVSDEDVAAVRKAGWGDGEIGEIVAIVSMNLFTNYFNHVAETEVDFPEPPPLT